MVRVVADTNVLISALMFGGLPGTFLELALMQSFQLLTSAVLLDELDDKLRVKFKVAPDDIALLRDRLQQNAIVVVPDVHLKVIAEDPDDDRVLECAVTGNADYIVSGDRHPVSLNSFQGISILSVRRFMDAVESGLQS